MTANEGMRILFLYRQVLRLHQRKLPQVARDIGDRYVRQEFKAHKKVTPEQHRQFILQWTDYAAHLATEADIFGLGRDLPQDYIDSLNEQQQEQLQKIHDSAVKIQQPPSENESNK